MEIIGNTVVEAINDVLGMFGMETTYDGETICERLESSSQVNVLIGITLGGGGSILLGMDNSLAFHIASTMMCGMDVQEMTGDVKSALAELTNMLMGNILTKIQTSDNTIDISPPTVVTGNKVQILLSKIKAHRILLRLGEHKFHMTFSIQ